MNWISLILLKLFICIIFINETTLSFTYINEINQYNYTEFSNLSLHYYDKSRNEYLMKYIHQMKGIYQNKSKSNEMNLEDTILITVLSYNEIHTKHYKIYFKNFLCFIQHYKLNLLVYLVHHDMKDLDQEIHELEHFVDNQNIRIVTYPDYLYWSLLSSKTNMMLKGKGKANYLHGGDKPSFTNHGALVMLVPVLEILKLGYNVIFFDVDIGFVLDPIPYMIQGTADFVTSIESRSCPDTYPIPHTHTYHTLMEVNHSKHNPSLAHIHDDRSTIQLAATQSTKLPNTTTTTTSTTSSSSNTILDTYSDRDKYYSTTEPNTGVMLVRATVAGIRFYQQWLHRIIQANVMNDQKVMQFKALNAIYNPDCFYSNVIKQPLSFKFQHASTLNNNKSFSSRSSSSNRNATYCFLSELLFQNGETAFRCAIKPSYRDNYVLGMYQHGVMDPIHHQDNMIYMHSHSHSHLQSNQRYTHSQTQLHSRYPVLIHANYCDKKSHELDMRGLWLLNRNHSISHQHTAMSMNDNSNHCIDYKIQHTEYHSLNWTKEALKVYKKRRYIYKTFVKNDTLIRSSNSKTIYLITENKTKITIPDMNTFLYMFGDTRFNEVKTLPHEVVAMIPLHDMPIYPTIKEILVPQWINDTSVLLSHQTSRSSSTRNNMIEHQIKYIYRPIHLMNGTLLRIDDSDASSKNQQLVYMLDVVENPSQKNDGNNNSNKNNFTTLLKKSEDHIHNQQYYQKRQICDQESFLQYFKESQWMEIVLVPFYILNSLSDGMPIMSIHYRHNCTDKLTTTISDV